MTLLIFLQETSVMVVHLCGAMIAFGFGVFYLWSNTFFSFLAIDKLNTKRMAIFRLILSILSTITFALSTETILLHDYCQV